MTPTLRFRVIHERNYMVSMKMSFFTMPSQRRAGRPLQTGAHGQRPWKTMTSCSCARFEAARWGPLLEGMVKKDIFMLFSACSFLGALWKGSTFVHFPRPKGYAEDNAASMEMSFFTMPSHRSEQWAFQNGLYRRSNGFQGLWRNKPFWNDPVRGPVLRA